MKTYYSRAAGVRTRGKTFSLESREVRMRLNTLAAVFLGAMFLLALAGCHRSTTEPDAVARSEQQAPTDYELATPPKEALSEKVLEQKGGILAKYGMTTGLGWETLAVLKKPIDAKELENQFGTPAKIEKDASHYSQAVDLVTAKVGKDASPLAPGQSGSLTLPKKEEIWQYGRIDLFVRDGNVWLFAVWKDARDSRLIAYLARLGAGVRTSKLIEGTAGSPDRLHFLNKPVDVNEIVRAFGKTDRLEKKTGFTQTGFRDEWDEWVYGRITLVVKDGMVLHFLEWDERQADKLVWAKIVVSGGLVPAEVSASAEELAGLAKMAHALVDESEFTVMVPKLAKEKKVAWAVKVDDIRKRFGEPDSVEKKAHKKGGTEYEWYHYGPTALLTDPGTTGVKAVSAPLGYWTAGIRSMAEKALSAKKE